MEINSINTLNPRANTQPMPSEIKTKTDTAMEVSRPRKIQESEEVKNEKTTKEEFKEIAIELNEYMDDLQTNLGFSIREEMENQIIVEIKDRKTGELIKQIPAEELLDIRKKMEEITGLLFDRKV